MLIMTLALSAAALSPTQDNRLEEISDSLDYRRRRTPVVRVVEAASPAVVYIETDTVVQERDFLGRVRSRSYGGSGSGVVIMKEGFIVTNYHVVKNARTITVHFNENYDTRKYAAELVSFVEQEDLALLSIQGDSEFPTVPLGTSSDLMIGEPVLAIGNPYGQTHTVSTGIISGLHRDVAVSAQLNFDDLIQTDASINFGNSGGPLLNINGQLIGINSAMNTKAENIGFAIPVDQVRFVLEDQLLSPESSRAWLGFTVRPDDRLIVDKVFENGPAAAAGLRKGDRVTSIDEKDVRTHDEYRLARLQIAPGAPVQLNVNQAGRQLDLKLATWNKADGVLYERLGIAVEDVQVRSQRYALVRVKRVFEDSPASELGLQVGDWIETVYPLSGPLEQAWRIVSRDALAKLVSKLDANTAIKLNLYRDLNKNGRYETRELHEGRLVLR